MCLDVDLIAPRHARWRAGWHARWHARWMPTVEGTLCDRDWRAPHAAAPLPRVAHTLTLPPIRGSGTTICLWPHHADAPSHSTPHPAAADHTDSAMHGSGARWAIPTASTAA